MNPLRVLHVFSSLGRGGAETMIMNIYRKIDRDKIQFDFIVNENDCKYAYEDEINQLGGKIFCVPKFSMLKFFSYKNIWKRLLNEHPEWSIVHVHYPVAAAAYVGMAKAMNKKIIAHSHNTDNKTGMLKSYIKTLMRYPLRYKADYLFACSKQAAEWMFGRKSAYIIKNAIDSNEFVFNPKIREHKRAEMNINDNFVIGHVGKFHPQKNHEFLIDIFFEVKKKCAKSVLLLVGDGPLRAEAESKAKNLGIADSVIFTGVRTDTADLLQVMDVFVFPSLYEGLGLVVIEAQASSLPCVISSVIPDEVRITNLVKFMSLHKSAEAWAEKILQFANNMKRVDMREEIKNAGYDVKEQVKLLSELYTQLLKSSV